MGVSIMYQGHIVEYTLRHEDMRLLLKFIRYHEMIGLRSSSKEFRLGSSGFLSNLRGEYVKPMVDAIDTPPEGESASLNGKTDGANLTHTHNIIENSPAPRLSSVYTTIMHKSSVKKAAVDEESNTENSSDEYDALRTLIRKKYDNDASSKPLDTVQRTSNVNNAVPTKIALGSQGRNKS